MAHFSYTRAGGIWTAGLPVLHTEFASFDAKTFAAINGDGGGVWAPSSVIEIGGSGINLTAFNTVSGGTLEFVNAGATLNSDVNGVFSWAGAATFTGSVAVTSVVPFTVSSGCTLVLNGPLDALGNTTIGATATPTLTVNSTSTFANGVTFGGSGSVTFSGTVTIGGTPTLAQPLSLTGTGRVKKRMLVMPDSDTTVTPATYDLVFVPPGVLSAARNVTIDDTNAVDGDVIDFSNWNDATHNLVVKKPGGGTLQTLIGSSGGKQACKAIRQGGTWYLFSTSSSA